MLAVARASIPPVTFERTPPATPALIPPAIVALTDPAIFALMFPVPLKTIVPAIESPATVLSTAFA